MDIFKASRIKNFPDYPDLFRNCTNPDHIKWGACLTLELVRACLWKELKRNEVASLVTEFDTHIYTQRQTILMSRPKLFGGWLDQLEFERHCAAREDGEAERWLDRFAEVDIGSPRDGEAERRLDRFAEVDLGPPRDRNGERRLDRSLHKNSLF